MILATGMLDATPDVEGFEAIYGISAHTCPYCDGWEHRDERIAVYAAGEAAAHMGPLLRQWSADTVVVDPAEVTRFVSRDGHLTHIELADGTSLERDALFFNVAMHPRVDLAVQLGCALTENGFVESAPLGPRDVGRRRLRRRQLRRPDAQRPDVDRRRRPRGGLRQRPPARGHPRVLHDVIRLQHLVHF